MARLLLAGWVCVTLIGCAPARGHVDGMELSHTGTIRKAEKISRPSGGSAALYAFGALGGIMNAALQGPTKTLNVYTVKASNGYISIQTAEEFAVGDCVRIEALNGWSSQRYHDGEAKIEKSRMCAAA